MKNASEIHDHVSNMVSQLRRKRDEIIAKGLYVEVAGPDNKIEKRKLQKDEVLRMNMLELPSELLQVMAALEAWSEVQIFIHS